MIIITWDTCWTCTEPKRTRDFQRTQDTTSKNKFKYFTACVWHLTLCEMWQSRAPGTPLGKNKQWELFANVIWLWSAQQPSWVYAIRKNMSAWGRFTASEPGARLAKEWDADWLSTCWNCVNVSICACEFFCDGEWWRGDDATTFFLGKHMNSTLCEGVRLYICLCSVGSQGALWAGAELTAH